MASDKIIENGLEFNKCWKNIIKMLIPVSKFLVQNKLIKNIVVIEQSHPTFFLEKIGPNLMLAEDDIKKQNEDLIFSSFKDYFQLAKEANPEFTEDVMNEIVEIFMKEYKTFKPDKKTIFWNMVSLSLMNYQTHGILVNMDLK